MVSWPSANYSHGPGVRRRRSTAFPAGSHIQEGRDESACQDPPKEVHRSRQRCVLTPDSPSADGIRPLSAANEELDIRIPDNDESLSTFIVNINESLDKLDLEIVSFVDGLTGDPVYVFVRPRSCPPSPLSGGSLCLLHSPTGKVTRSRRWPRIIHLRSWHTSKFSYVSVISFSRPPLYTRNPGRNDRHST